MPYEVTPTSGLYAPDGSVRATFVSGDRWVGAYAPDGSMNLALSDGRGLYHRCGAYNYTAVETNTVPLGAYAPDGSLYVTTSLGTSGWYAPNGAMRVSVVWVARGPDGRAPVQQSEWSSGLGWLGGTTYATPTSYLTAASGTFSRASTATYFDATGLLKTASANALRLDYEGGIALGYRAEGGRSNHFSGGALSTAFTSADSATASLDTGLTNPYGTLSAVVLTLPLATSRLAWHTGLGNTVVSLSQFVQQHTSDGQLRYGVSGDNPALLRAQATLTPSWQRVFYTGSTGANPFAYPVDSRFTTGLMASSARLYGHQVEVAPFPSSYISEVTSPSSRAADSLSYAIAGTAEGSVLVHARTPLGVDGSQMLWCWDDGTTSNRLRVVRTSDSNIHFVVTTGGVDRVDLDLGASGNNAKVRVAVSWKSGAYAASLNGGPAVTSAYVGALPSVTTLREGSSANGEEWFGTIARMARYDVAYAGPQLSVLSA